MGRVDYSRKTIHPGELYLTRKPCRIATLLGSCVAVTVHDRKLQYGGMNHFMLPTGTRRNRDKNDFRYGDISTRELFDKMLRLGSERGDLVVKLFGGGMVVPALEKADIGKKNVQTARDIISEYNLEVEKEFVRPRHGLKIIFNNHTNKVLVKNIKKEEKLEKDLETREEKITNILSDIPGVEKNEFEK